MMQELYIEGKRVDMFTDPITLDFRSNLFGDIDKITSSRSYTIELPATPNNDFIFNLSSMPISNGIARRWYDATYCIDGIQIIRGRVALLSCKPDTYEVMLMWGVVARLSEFLESESTLRDLPINIMTAIRANNLYLCDRTKSIVGVYYYNNGNEDYLFPVINAGYIFNLILGSSLLGRVDVSAIDMTFINNLYINVTENLVEEVGTRSFYIRDYLPEIKCVEYFKGICHLMGWYIEVTSDYGLRIVPLNVISNKANAVDWSGKLASPALTPVSVSFSYEDYARRNYMRYKKDDNVSVDADGYIEVDSVTAQKENTLFELPWSASVGNIIEQYKTVLDDSGNPVTDFVKIEPRILEFVPDAYADEEGDDVIPTVEFTDALRLRNIIYNHYSYYQAVLASPLVIEAELKLTVFDLLNLDFTRPVFIDTYGGYYAIMELTTQGDITAAKLIKLP